MVSVLNRAPWQWCGEQVWEQRLEAGKAGS